MVDEDCKHGVHVPAYLKSKDKFICTECGKEWLPTPMKAGNACPICKHPDIANCYCIVNEPSTPMKAEEECECGGSYVNPCKECGKPIHECTWRREVLHFLHDHIMHSQREIDERFEALLDYLSRDYKGD